MENDRSVARLNALANHLNLSSSPLLSSLSLEKCKSIEQINNEPRKKEKIKWNGWGYADSKFVVENDGSISMSGPRYSVEGKLPYLREFVEKEMGIALENRSPSQSLPKKFPAPIENLEFLKKIQGAFLRMTTDGLERQMHSHGHTVQELWNIRYGSLSRLVDMVIYPGKHEDVEIIVREANACNVVIIPYGGGTNVSRALECPKNEKRMIVSLDMREMDKVKWIDRTNMIACIEAGIAGKDLVHKLEDVGLTMGHEPDSLEFSTLGGWISTRASGMKKNMYGNIEDLVVDLKVVTSIGTWQRECLVPRLSSGPDILQIFLGQEGNFGVITEATVRVHNIPPVKRYGAVAFPNFEQGVKFMHYVALNKAQPASLRLVDPEQFRFGQALKPAPNSWIKKLVSKAQKIYLDKILNFDLHEMCAATIVFEGTKEKVSKEEQIIYAAARKFNGIKADEENGRRGYYLTFSIAYLRDLGMELSFLAESFETSVQWSQTYALCVRVKERIFGAAKEIGIKAKPFVSCRVTQVYDVGSCVYFYFGFSYKGLDKPDEKFTFVEHAAREEILKCGGSISHHHGVGKHRKRFIEKSIGPIGVGALRALKNTLDPKNIFASGNTFDLEGVDNVEH